MTVKRRKWGSVSERKGKWLARWQENGKRRQKGGFSSRSEGDRFLRDKELELFRDGFLPEPHPLANAMDIAIESIDTMQCADGDVASAQPSDKADGLGPLDLDQLEAGDVVSVELAERPRRRMYGTVIKLDRSGSNRMRALTIAVRLEANQIAAVLGRKKQS